MCTDANALVSTRRMIQKKAEYDYPSLRSRACLLLVTYYLLLTTYYLLLITYCLLLITYYLPLVW